jgi:hypothetical protein
MKLYLRGDMGGKVEKEKRAGIEIQPRLKSNIL